jgi:hypothetical protein
VNPCRAAGGTDPFRRASRPPFKIPTATDVGQLIFL